MASEKPMVVWEWLAVEDERDKLKAEVERLERDVDIQKTRKEEARAEVKRLWEELDKRLDPSQGRLLKKSLAMACGTTVEDIECRPMGAAKELRTEVERLKAEVERLEGHLRGIATVPSLLVDKL